jgi:hypothetical protein
VVRLDGRFHQLAAVSGEQSRVVLEAQTLAPIVDRDLAQRMQFTLARAVEGDFSTVEQVELTREGAF